MTGLCLVLVGAGSATVHSLLVFAIHSLSLHPEYQRRIRREVHEAFKNHGVADFNFDVIRSLSFTYQCLFEASRLYPSAAFLLRKCLEDFQVPGTNYIFRKGDRVMLPTYSSARDEKQFCDPHSFKPERFVSKDANMSIPGSLLTFGIGQRKCPGYQHGLFVAAGILASLLQNYEIKPRSHLKQIDATDFDPKTFMTAPRRELLVDLVRCENLDGI